MINIPVLSLHPRAGKYIETVCSLDDSSPGPNVVRILPRLKEETTLTPQSHTKLLQLHRLIFAEADEQSVLKSEWWYLVTRDRTA